MGKDLISKIDTYLEGKKGAVKISAKSFIPMKKLMESNWGEEDYLRDTAIECISNLAKLKGDPIANEFMKRLHKEAKTIGEAVIKMYMTNNSIDSLPNR